MHALCPTCNTWSLVALVRERAQYNSTVFCFEVDEQDIQVEGEAEEKEEGEEAKREKQEIKKEEEEEVEEGDDQDIMTVLGNLVVAMFIKYWIYVCGGMFFFVSFEGKIVMYKIIYMVLFLFCVALYQVGKRLSSIFLSSHLAQESMWASFDERLSYYNPMNVPDKVIDAVQTSRIRNPRMGNDYLQLVRYFENVGS